MKKLKKILFNKRLLIQLPWRKSENKSENISLVVLATLISLASIPASEGLLMRKCPEGTP